MNLDHTIVPSKDKVEAAKWFARVFVEATKAPRATSPRSTVDDTLTLDFDNSESFESHHYAFLVSEEEFDDIFRPCEGRGHCLRRRALRSPEHADQPAA